MTRFKQSFAVWLALILAVPAAADPHPLLVFGPGDVATLQARVTQSPQSSWYASVKSTAQAGLAYRGTDEALRSRYAAAMAFVHLIEGGSAYRDQTAAFLATVGDDDTDWNTFGWTWGGDLVDYGLAYDWIQPALSVDEETAILAKLEAASAKTFTFFMVPPTSGADKYYTNVRLRVAGGLGLVALAQASYGGASTRLGEVVDDLFGSTHQIPRQLSAVVGRDGIYKEGNSYQEDSFGALLPFLLAYHHVTGTNLLTSPPGYDDRLARMFASNAALMMPNRGAPTLNTGWQGRSSYHELVAGQLTDGAEQMWYFDQAGRIIQRPNLAIVFYDAAFDAAKRPPTSSSIILDNAAVFRSDWSADATWLMVDSDDEASRSTHDQPDQTSLMLYARRAYLLIDPGDGRNYSAAGHEWLRYSPVAHNLVIVDGMEGPIGTAPATPSKNWRYESDAEPPRDPASVRAGFVSPLLDYVEVGIDSYFDAPDVSTRRSVFFPGREYAVVLDQMQSSSSHDYDSVWHLGGNESATAIEGQLLLGANELRWTTKNENNADVELDAVFVNPAVTLGQHTGYTNWRGGETKDHTYVKARATGGDVSFLVLLLPRALTEAAPALAVGGNDVSSAGAVLALAGHTDTHGLALTGGTLSVGALVADASYAYARESGGQLAVLGLKNGTRLAWGASEWLTSSCAVTLVVDVASAEAYFGQVIDPHSVCWLELRVPAGAFAEQVTLDGVDLTFAQNSGRVRLDLVGGGELRVGFGSTPPADGGISDSGSTISDGGPADGRVDSNQIDAVLQPDARIVDGGADSQAGLDRFAAVDGRSRDQGSTVRDDQVRDSGADRAVRDNGVADHGGVDGAASEHGGGVAIGSGCGCRAGSQETPLLPLAATALVASLGYVRRRRSSVPVNVVKRASLGSKNRQ